MADLLSRGLGWIHLMKLEGKFRSLNKQLFNKGMLVLIGEIMSID